MAIPAADKRIEKIYHSANPLITDAEAAIIGPMIEELAEAGKGQTQDIIEAARPADSPLHRYFTWDDARAAERYRVQEARTLARSFRVEIIEIENTQRTTFIVPGVASIRYTDGTRGYETLRQIQADDEKLEQIIADAAGRLAYWRKMFSAYRNIAGFQRFEPIFQALEAIEAAD